jgi:hypothetical protein
MRIRHTLCAATLAIHLSACAPGSGQGLDENGLPPELAGANIELAPNLESLQARLFTPNCAVSGCHSGSSAPLGLDLSDGRAYPNLVSRASEQQPGTLRIAPGDATNSYIVQKLEGAAGISGEPMPRGRPRLDPALIDTLKVWINAGAPATANTASSAPVVTRASITANSGIDALPTTLQIVFSSALNPLTIVDQTLLLQASGNDAVFDNGNETDLIVQPGLSTDGRTLTLDLSSNPDVGNNSINEDYRLVIRGSGLIVVRGVDEQVLDGDNDGQPGGDYTLQFYVGSKLRPTLASLEQNLFGPNCAKSGCHSGSAPILGMNLEPGKVFANTVGIAAVFQPSTQRINPGNADASAIVQALEGTAASIPQMPFDSPGSIPQADIDVLRQWINSGANP